MLAASKSRTVFVIRGTEHGRVRGLDGVWGVGDGTAFTLKSGGFAAEQADVAAADIARAARADVEQRSFDPNAGEELAGLPAGHS